MELTPKQQQFVDEYLIDRNGKQAAIRAGYDWPIAALGFYVYFLIDGRTGHIFYVGKGKGRRISQHRRDALLRSPANPLKAHRIRDCGANLEERIFAHSLSEPAALNIERSLIKQLRAFGLTNITSGNVRPLQSQLAKADADLDALRPFDEWVLLARPDQIEAATKLKGSPAAFYAYILGSLLRLREKTANALFAVNVQVHHAVQEG